ncbi:MAG: hypothetical protein U1C13_04070, partial [Pseudomonas sp.]|nr:hypothetical protein [Pseudomonas sp.]
SFLNLLGCPLGLSVGGRGGARILIRISDGHCGGHIVSDPVVVKMELSVGFPGFNSLFADFIASVLY